MAQTILVADDSATMRQVVTMALKGSPYRVVTVGGGEEALKAAYEHRPSLVLLDYHLPDRSGLEVCRAMKGDPTLRHIPVLILGGTYHPFSVDEARRCGSEGVLTKPFRTDDLQEKVRELANESDGVKLEPRQAPVNKDTPLTSVPLRAGGSTQVGVPAIGSQSLQPPAAQRRPPVGNRARYGSSLAPPKRAAPPAPPVAAVTKASTPTAPPRVPDAPAPPAASGGNLDLEEIRRQVRDEVQRAVREEMLAMVKSVLGDLFKERMMPKLLSYGQERVEAIVTRDLQSIMERRVEEELAKLTGE